MGGQERSGQAPEIAESLVEERVVGFDVVAAGGNQGLAAVQADQRHALAADLTNLDQVSTGDLAWMTWEAGPGESSRSASR